MIDALIGGKIAKQPEQRQSKSGKHFVTTSLSASVGNGESGTRLGGKPSIKPLRHQEEARGDARAGRSGKAKR